MSRSSDESISFTLPRYINSAETSRRPSFEQRGGSRSSQRSQHTAMSALLDAGARVSSNAFNLEPASPGSPSKSPSGIAAPANTRVNSATTTPMNAIKLGTSSGSRSTSVLASIETPSSDSTSTPQSKGRARATIRARKPRNASGSVKSRKEGKATTETPASHIDQRKPSFGAYELSDQENPVQPGTTSDGKRKRLCEGRPVTRAFGLSDPNLQLPPNLATPERKGLKAGDEDDASPAKSEGQDPINPEDMVHLRTPLSSLHSL